MCSGMDLYLGTITSENGQEVFFERFRFDGNIGTAIGRESDPTP